VAKPSPFGPVDRWRDPAREYVDTPAMKKLQEMYPDPPLVLFVSNNEAPDLRWHQVEELSRRYLDKYGKGRSDEFKRKVVAEGWIQRYPVMFQAMREALVRGGAPARRWLVYAHSPLEDRRGVEITPPEFGEVTVDVPQKSATWGRFPNLPFVAFFPGRFGNLPHVPCCRSIATSHTWSTNGTGRSGRSHYRESSNQCFSTGCRARRVRTLGFPALTPRLRFGALELGHRELLPVLERRLVGDDARDRHRQ